MVAVMFLVALLVAKSFLISLIEMNLNIWLYGRQIYQTKLVGYINQKSVVTIF